MSTSSPRGRRWSAEKGSRSTCDPEVLDAREAAALLSAPVEDVRRLARRGDEPAFELGTLAFFVPFGVGWQR